MVEWSSNTAIEYWRRNNGKAKKEQEETSDSLAPSIGIIIKDLDREDCRCTSDVGLVVRSAPSREEVYQAQGRVLTNLWT